MKKLSLLSVIGFLLLIVSVSYAQMDAVQNQPAKVGNWKDSELAGMDASKNQLPTGDGMNDHLARVFNVKGDVRILKKGTEDWTKLKKERVIEVGDQILTGKDSFVEIVYDQFFLNIARIDEKTKAEFRTIEPTDLHLEDGSIFSALDGLSKGDAYQISTPTAVAGVRGTHFNVDFDAATRIFNAATIPDLNDHQSQVFVNPIEVTGSTSDQGIIVPEGSHVRFDEQMSTGVSLEVGVLPQETIQDAQETFKEMSEGIDNFSELREEGEKKLEETSDDHKSAGDGNPPGGGDGGAGDIGGPDSGAEHAESDSHLPSADAIVDTLIPAAVETQTGAADEAHYGIQHTYGLDKKGKGETTKDGEASDNSGQAEGADLNSAMKFLALGGVGHTDGKGQHDEKSITNMLSTFGVSSEAGSQMAQDISRAAETGGVPTVNHDTWTHSADTSFQMDPLSHESSYAAHDFGSMATEQTKSEENYNDAHTPTSSGGCAG